MKLLTKSIKKCIAIICAISQLLILFAMPSVAYSINENTEDSSDVVLEDESSSGTAETLSSPARSSSYELTYSIIDPTVPAPATTRIVFDDTNIVDCTFEYEGLTVVKEPNAMILISQQ